MNDKQVGELWATVTGDMADDFGDHGADVIDLIRKLVKERNINNDDWGLTFEQFGIDPATWNWK